MFIPVARFQDIPQELRTEVSFVSRTQEVEEYPPTNGALTYLLQTPRHLLQGNGGGSLITIHGENSKIQTIRDEKHAEGVASVTTNKDFHCDRQPVHRIV